MRGNLFNWTKKLNAAISPSWENDVPSICTWFILMLGAQIFSSNWTKKLNAAISPIRENNTRMCVQYAQGLF